MKIIKKVVLAASLAIGTAANAQTTQDALRLLDIDQFNKAGQTFEKLLATDPSAKNYYYTGYYYLRTQNPIRP